MGCPLLIRTDPRCVWFVSTVGASVPRLLARGSSGGNVPNLIVDKEDDDDDDDDDDGFVTREDEDLLARDAAARPVAPPQADDDNAEHGTRRARAPPARTQFNSNPDSDVGNSTQFRNTSTTSCTV